jgi:hypothetical protein
MPTLLRLLRRLITIAFRLGLFVALVWAFGALWFDFPVPEWRKAAAIALAVLVVAAFIVFRSTQARLAVLAALAASVAGWWLTLQPQQDRPWQPDVAETAWAEINGDTVTLHNVRYCDYRTETDYTPRWEKRTVRLSQLTGIDVAICYWGSPWMAHPIVSFQFADVPPVCFSIETRKEKGEGYSAVGGLYRQYELTCVVADERDVLRLRTNYRTGEDVYLYRLTLTPETARRRFMEYINSINQLRSHPRWYHALTTNCTTAIRGQHPVGERIPWDWRMLVNGKMDEMLFDHRLLNTGGLDFPALKERAHINPRARTASVADFSRAIRHGMTGMK